MGTNIFKVFQWFWKKFNFTWFQPYVEELKKWFASDNSEELSDEMAVELENREGLVLNDDDGGERNPSRISQAEEY